MPAVSGVVYDTAGAAVGGRTVRAYRRDTGALLASRLSASGYVAADADYANVSLLLHCNGTNGSTTITDSSPTPKVAVLTGNTSISTTNSKFGGASIYFDGTGDILNFTPLTDFAFGTGDFTIELFATAVSTGALVDMRVNSSTNGSQPILYFTAGTIRYYTNLDDRITSGVLTNGQMYHFAVCRSGTSTKMFVDGVQVGSTYTDSNNYVAGSMTFGATANGLGPYQGYIDEVRITNGVARYTANFTPHTVAHPDSSTALSTGGYSITTAYTGEVNVIALDDSGGTVTNDIIIRTTPV